MRVGKIERSAQTADAVVERHNSKNKLSRVGL
jgi:hypothetical protein